MEDCKAKKKEDLPNNWILWIKRSEESIRTEPLAGTRNHRGASTDLGRCMQQRCSRWCRLAVRQRAPAPPLAVVAPFTKRETLGVLSQPTPTVQWRMSVAESLKGIGPELRHIFVRFRLETGHCQMHRRLPRASRRFPMSSEHWELGRQHGEWRSEWHGTSLSNPWFC